MRFLPLLFCLNITLFANSFYTQREVVQGEPITFVVIPEGGNYSYEFYLYKKDKKLLSFKGFNYYIDSENLSVILGIGAIPSDFLPGNYIVKAEGKGFLETYYFERTLRVVEGGFKIRELKANGKMDSLSNGKREPERDIQAKRWWDTISRFNPYSFHHTENLQLPVKGAKRSSPFGFKRIVKYPSGKLSNSTHNGEDLAIKTGTPIYSDGSGKVVLSENRIISGNTVIVEHLPGIFTLYYHMDSMVLEVGEKVKQGDLIGYVGTTGYSTGPHLHWEIRIGTIPVNPNYFLNRSLIDKTLIMNIISDTNTKKGG